MGNSTSFKPGYDSRRYVATRVGLKDYEKLLSEKLTGYSLEAADVMVRAMRGEKIGKVQLVAAQNIIDRTAGSVVSQVLIKTLSAPEDKDVTQYTSLELRQIISKLTPEGVVIEGEVVEVESPKYSDIDVKASLKKSGVE